MTDRDPAEIVGTGYDAIASRYSTWAAAIVDDPRTAWLTRLADDLPAGARLLDLGCGNGMPTARWLVDRGFDVTGVDVSIAQIERARRAVPSARFMVADMRAVDFAPASFDAVIALFSLIHVPREQLGAVLVRVRGWLSPGGRLLATFGVTDDEGVQADWLGVPMFFSGTSPGVTAQLLAAAGFSILHEASIEQDEGDEETVTFHWVDAAAS